MAIVGFGAITPVTVVGGSFTPVSLSGVAFTAGNWNGDTPGNLGAIADGNTATATTWGRTYGGGNKGWIQADFGQTLNRVYLEVLIGLRMNAGWDGGESTWTVEASSNTQFFLPLWQAIRIKPTSNERVLLLNLWGGFRYLRATAEDVGAGQTELRWYDLRAWQMNL